MGFLAGGPHKVSDKVSVTSIPISLTTGANPFFSMFVSGRSNHCRMLKRACIVVHSELFSVAF